MGRPSSSDQRLCIMSLCSKRVLCDCQDRSLEPDIDLVLWHCFGVTHIVRPEDFPVMPVESTGFTLKPVGFFRGNPATDVPYQANRSSKLCCSDDAVERAGDSRHAGNAELADGVAGRFKVAQGDSVVGSMNGILNGVAHKIANSLSQEVFNGMR